MDDAPSLPLVFANRVIRQFADHLLGGDIVIEPKDFMVLRIIFRKLGGKWWDLSRGSIAQLVLLEKILTNWGNQPGRKRESEET